MYGMREHDSDFFMKAKELTIHVVDASQSFEFEGGGATHVWEEIMHCLPAVVTLNMIYVGLEVCISHSLTPVNVCAECKSRGRTRTQAIHEMTYQDYGASEEFIKPDLVVAFNTGMNEVDTDIWKGSLDVMLSLDVPCIFTAFTKQEGEADLSVLGEVNARTLSDAPVPNPFCVSIPAVDDAGGVDSFFQPNMYCICFRGRADTSTKGHDRRHCEHP